MTNAEKRKIYDVLDAELELIMSKDLTDNHDLLLGAAAILELREYLSVREGLLAAADQKQHR